jgi:antitoxin component of MazEF toxin-antitoxin module
MNVRLLIQGTGKTAAGMEVPAAVVEALGAGKKPPVRVTIGGHTYRSTIASMGGTFMLGISNENRAKAGVAAGDEVDVELELDTEPREVTVPADLRAALDADPTAAATFEKLSYSNRLRHVLAIDDAKTPETRQRRIEKSVALFHEGRS